MSLLVVVHLALAAPVALPGEPCGDTWVCGGEQALCRCDPDRGRVYEAFDDDDDGTIDITQAWLDPDDRGQARTLRREYGDRVEIVRLGSDGVDGLELHRGDTRHDIRFAHVISEAPDVFPESFVPFLRDPGREGVQASGDPRVVRSTVLDRLYPGSVLVQGRHPTGYFEYPVLTSLVWVQHPDDPPLAVVEPMWDSKGWPAFLDGLTGITLTDADADALAWTLAAIFQPMFDGATGHHPTPLVPRTRGRTVEIDVTRGNARAATLQLVRDGTGRLTAVRLNR